MLTELQIRKFTKLFTMFDSDNTGHLNLADFQKIAQKVSEFRGWKSNSSEADNLSHKFLYYWIHLKGEVDKNRDSKVSLDEWLNYYDDMLNNPKRYEVEVGSLINLIFDVFDADGDGTIDRNEWVNLLSTYNSHRIYAEKAFSQIDINKDGCLSKEEVLKLFHDFHYSDEPQALGNLLFSPY